MLHCFSSKLALRALVLSILLAVAIVMLFARSNAADGAVGPTQPLTIETSAGRFTYKVEVAATEAERERGLMFRRSMPEDHGMLFDMGRTAPATFWMHHTPMSLDIIFIGADGKVVSVAPSATPNSDAMIGSGAPVRFVLELNAERAAAMKLKAGDAIRSDRIAAAGG
jgi:uncharacterized membrane protein (UPF0127 family)